MVLTLILEMTGSLYISAEQDNERVHIRSDDGSGGLTDYFDSMVIVVSYSTTTVIRNSAF